MQSVLKVQVLNVLKVPVLRVLRVLRVLTVQRVLPVLMAVASIAAHAEQQGAALRDGVITGRVVDAVSGRPVSAAIVTITGTGVSGRPPAPGTLPTRPVGIVTGADGRFIFPELTTPGTFTITATKGGYADGASGRRRPGGASQAVSLDATQKSSDIIVRVWKNGAIAGRVVDEAGEAVIGVRVVALARTSTFGRPQFVPSANALTDDRGMYRFSNLPAGDYVVVATPPMVSMKATVFEDVARAGRVSSELAGTMAGAAMNGMVVSGDAVLPLGRGSVIPPTSRGGRLQVYPPTLHPSATTPSQAAVVTIASGEERTGIDVQLMPASTSRVSGTLLGPSGPAGDVRVQLVPARGEDLPLDMLAPVSMSDSTGGFVFAGVVPGEYTLRATQAVGARAGQQLHWVELPITVSGEDIDGVTAVLAPPLRLTARLQFEGNASPPQQSGRFTNTFSLEPVDRPPTPLPVAGTIADDTVTLAGYLPGRYRVRVFNSPAGWMFKSAMLNGVDVSETPFDLTRDVTGLVLTFTDRWSGISGRAQGADAGGATVLVFTTDAQKWQGAGSNPRRLRSGRANARGEFGISSLPPGDYYLTAIREEDAGDWRDPATLEALARGATQITIMEGEHKSLDVTVREVRR